jgi:hypothetical protein
MSCENEALDILIVAPHRNVPPIVFSQNPRNLSGLSDSDFQGE